MADASMVFGNSPRITFGGFDDVREKKPTLDELLEELNHPRVDVDWKSDDVQPELLAEVDPDEIGWDWEHDSNDAQTDH